MKTILVATDFSERSDRALRRATLLALQFGATLALVHVVDDDQPRRIVEAERDAAAALLRQTAATLEEMDGVVCRTRVVLASPFLGILEAVADMSPDLLVIGPHRRQVLRDVFIGTTAERVIRSVDCPVLMVNAPPAGPYGHIMQTTDLSDCSRDALRRFSLLGIGAGARNSLLHTFHAPALRLVMGHVMQKEDREKHLADERRDAALELSRFVASVDIGQARQVLRYEASPAPHEILKAANEEDADLIVMSTHGRSGLLKMLLGSVTEQVFRTAQIDVLAIPPQREE
ncbi:Nucleotide-binding universal stress protein, UspA family [Roseovarius pacificus]|uniref:Nucleotide-binding universal stress protein, UspA family n=1 Tax=Roseovarius pacificus TaxID=337701 RepID=A0A1M6YKR1_9RHOB|nr:universal stress protein [Roseovarius pacificus]GGO50742.1 hypothetical protein GCM10011315_02240 [Roseovarius pacificus]SHL18672.1 Nucleotide-binding universal stress protein, UspA family [Roseovarius pacificus]